MGICASVPSTIHDDTHALDENAVYYSEISADRNGYTFSRIGSKEFNQDASILFQGYGIEDGVFCGVFDGHGKNGHIVSKLVRNRLPSLLLNQRNAIEKISLTLESDDKLSASKNLLKWKEACFSSFKLMDKEIKLLHRLDSSYSGTTAAVVIKQGDDLVIANIGDSRAVLGTKTESGIISTQLTTDLKPGLPGEAERIRKCNGRVLVARFSSVQRVCLPYDDSPGLAMSRSFGDFVLKNHGVIATPDISYRHLSSNDQFIVLASDGVWDMLSNDRVMTIVSLASDEEQAAKAVVNVAIAEWRERFPNSKIDDCTVICLFLQKYKTL